MAMSFSPHREMALSGVNSAPNDSVGPTWLIGPNLDKDGPSGPTTSHRYSGPMVNVHVALPHFPEMERALIPEAPIRSLMESAGAVSAERIKGRLTQVHEAAHATLMVVLRGTCCYGIQISSGQHATTLGHLDDEQSVLDDNLNLIDLAGLYGELHEMGDDRSCTWFHIKNATHDLDTARKRLNLRKPVATTWAMTYGPLARSAVAYFWPAIFSVATEVPAPPGPGELSGDRIFELVSSNLPTVEAPPKLRARLKPEFVVAASTQQQ